MFHVVIVIGRLRIGGAEIRTLQLLKKIKSEGIPLRVTVFIVSGEKGSLDEDYLALGVKLVYGTPGWRGLVKLFKAIRGSPPDVLHVNASLASGFYCCVGWLAGVRRRISHMRSTGYNDNGLLRAIRNFVYRCFLLTFSTKVVGVCDAANQLSRSPTRKWKTVYNGVVQPPYPEPTPSTRPETKDHFDLVFLGRLDREKDPVRALNIFRALSSGQSSLQFKLHYYGERGTLGDKLENIAASEIKAGKVLIHGPTDRPLHVLMRTDLLLLTSAREGLPGVVLEALACGTPVVAPPLPGVVEIQALTLGVTTVSACAAESDWARQIISVLKHADRMRIRRAFADSPFSLEAHFNQMIRLWTGLDPWRMLRSAQS